jgi:O-antigen/teichoic acid export membrane protein
LLSNIFSLSIARVINSIISFFTTLFLIKVLDVETYGNFKYGMSFVATFLFIQDMGIGLYGIRAISQDPAKARSFINCANWSRWLLVIVFVIFTAIFSLTIKNTELRWFVGLFTFSLLFDVIVNNATNYFIAIQKMAISVRFEIANKTLLFLSFLVLVSAYQNLYSIAISFIITRILVALYAWKCLKVESGFTFKWMQVGECVALIKESFPFVLSGLIINLYAQIDNLMLYWLMDEREVAFYGAGVFFVFGIAFIPRILTKALFPVFSVASIERRIDFRSSLFNLNIKWTLLVCLPIIAAVFPVSQPLLIFLTKPLYASADLVFRIYLICMFFSWLTISSTNFLNATQQEYKVVKICLVVLVIKTVINLIAIPVWGVNGAATGSAISEGIFLMLFYPRLAEYITKRELLGYMARLLPVVVATFFSSYLLRSHHFSISITISGLVFLTLSFVCKLWVRE